MAKKSESLSDLSAQIANLRKCRDGLIPYSTESLRQAKQSILNPILTPPTLSPGSLGTESRLRRKRMKSEEGSPTKEDRRVDEKKEIFPERLKIHSAEQYSRMATMTRLLMETLEEQGALRALIQHTTKENDPSFHSNFNNSFGSNDNSNKSSFPNIETRYQGTLLELEKTVQKLIQVRTDFEDEKQKRISLERALQIATKNLEETDLKLEEAKDELRLWRNGKMKEALATQSQPQPQGTRHHHAAVVSKDTRQRDPLPPPPLPPLPPPPEEEEDEEEEEEERSAPPRSSTSSHPQPKQQASPSSTSASAPPVSSGNSILLDIDLGDGKKGIIEVTMESNPVELAYQFIYQHALNPDYVYPLIDYISKTKVSLEDEQKRNRSSSPIEPNQENHRSSPETNPQILESLSLPLPKELTPPTQATNPQPNSIENLKEMLENGQISSPDELLHFISQFQPPSPSKSSPTPLSPAAATAVDSSPHTTPPIQRRNHSLTAANRLALPGMEAKSQQRQEEDPPEEEEEAEALELSPPQSPRLRYISNSPSASRSPSPAASVSTSASPSDSSESSLIFQNLPYQSPPPLSPPSEGRQEGVTEESEEQIVTPLVIDSPSRSGNGTFDLSVTMIADDDHNLLETRARGGAGRGEARGEARGGRRASSPSPPSSPITLHMFREEKPKRKYPQRQELSIKEQSRDNNSHSSSSSRNSSSHRKLEMQPTQLQMPMLPQQQAQQVQRQHRQMRGNEISLQSSVSIPSQAFKKGTRASAAAAAFEEDYDDLDYERLEELEGSDQLSDSDSELGSQLPVEDRYEEDEDSYYLEEDAVEDEETEQLQQQQQEQQQEQQEEEEEEIYKETHNHRDRSLGNDNNRGGGGVSRSRDEFNRKPHSQPYGPPSSSHQQKQWDEDTDEQQDEKQRQQEVEEEDEEDEEEEYSAVDREDDSNRSISSRPKPKPKPSSFDPEVLLSHLKSSKREMSPPPQRQRSSSPKTSRAQQTITSVRANSPLNSPKPSPRPEKLSRHSPKGKDNTRGAKDSGRRSKSRSRSPSPSAGQRAVSLGSSPEIVKELSIRADNVDPLEVAIEVFDSATTLANEGNLEDAIPLYLHALQIFEEFNYEELPMIREEIWKWVSLADEATAVTAQSHLLQRSSGRRSSSSASRSKSPIAFKADTNFRSSVAEIGAGAPMSLSEIKSPKRQGQGQGKSQQQQQQQQQQEGHLSHQMMTAAAVARVGGSQQNQSHSQQQQGQGVQGKGQSQQGGISATRRNSLRAPSIDLL